MNPPPENLPVQAGPATHVVVHRASGEYGGLVKTGWILMVVACGLALVPFFGFASWFIAGPFLLATFVLSIVIMTRGGTLSGILLLLASMFVAPVIVLVAPFVSSLLAVAGAGVTAGVIQHQHDSVAGENPTEATNVSSPLEPRTITIESPEKAISAKIEPTQNVDRTRNSKGDDAADVFTQPARPIITSEPRSGSADVEPVRPQQLLPTESAQSPKRAEENVREARVERAELAPDVDQPEGQQTTVRSGRSDNSSRRLTVDEIDSWNLARVRFAINEIYAHYGAVFPSRDIQAWANKQSWYHRIEGRTPEVVDQYLSDADRFNIEILAARRNALKSR